MFITWHGHSCIKIQSKDQVMVIDPYDQSIAPKPPIIKKSDAIIVTDPGLIDVTKFKETFVINNPGEYEIKGSFVHGLPAGRQTIYFLEVEGITMAHLGNIKEDLTQKQKEVIEEVDVLFIPVGGHHAYDFKKASGMIQEIEPRVVIPMSFQFPGAKLPVDTADKFIKEEGIKDATAVDKVRLSTKDLPADETHFYILKKQ